jgi:uncharacterized protein YlxW (UPF0749 family)
MFEKKIFTELPAEEQAAYVASAEAEIDALNTQIADLNDTIKSNEASMVEASKELAKLSAEAKSAKKDGKGVTVSIEKVKYQFTVKKFTYKGEKYEAEKAAKDAELCAELVKIGFGGLEPVK